MKSKTRQTLVILFLAISIAAVFHFIPGVINGLFVLYLNQLSAAKMILIGDPVICEELKSKMSSQSTVEKEQSYKELLALLTWPIAEYKDQVNKQSTNRQILTSLKDDTAPAIGGLHLSQRCLLETLGSFKNHFEETLPALFKSDLLNLASDSQMRAQVQSFIQKECQNQVGCAKPIRDEIIRLKDFNLSRVYLAMLARTGSLGLTSLFEIYDSLEEKDLDVQNSYSWVMAHNLLASLNYSDTTSREIALQEIDRRLADAKYSKLKKDFLVKTNPLRTAIIPIHASHENMVEILEKGEKLLASFKSKLPSTTQDLEAWLMSLQQVYAAKIEVEHRQKLSHLLDDFLLWSIKQLGADANIIEKIIQIAADKSKVIQPLPSAHKLLDATKSQLIGLRLLMLEVPLSDESASLVVRTFKKISQEQRYKAINALAVRGVQNLSGKTIFELSELLGSKEFVQLHYSFFSNKKDDYILNWKKYEKHEIDSNEKAQHQWRGYVINKDASLASSLRSYWIKNPVCSEDRLFEMHQLIGIHQDLKADSALIELFLSCYSKFSGEVSNFLTSMTYASSENSKLISASINSTKKLSSEEKKQILEKILVKVRGPYIEGNSASDDGT